MRLRAPPLLLLALCGPAQAQFYGSASASGSGSWDGEAEETAETAALRDFAGASLAAELSRSPGETRARTKPPAFHAA